MRVLGTAGHVDHGKSTLVERLTGINPDRLKEEQERQMTIDLGFAWMDLPDGEVVGIIDVPGHRDFIENMLAGVGGIDAGLLVVAADEGVMPQTREHLAILDLLEVHECVVAMTKMDLVEDAAWMEMVREEIAATLKPTRFAESQIVEVSAVTSTGLNALVKALSKALGEAEAKVDLGRPRLPIDRVFSIAGFGTVVTGTLIDGSLDVGEGVVVLPSGIKGRIRGLQTHKTKLKKAVPGSRVAANVSGIEVGSVERGDVVCIEGDYTAARVLDARVRLLPDSPSPIRHNQYVKIYIGAAQRMARVRLLGKDQIDPGEEGWVQLVLNHPIVAARGDRYIMRRPSPGATLGGGQIADAQPTHLYRRSDPTVATRLDRLLHGMPADVLAQALLSSGPLPMNEIVARSGLDGASAAEAVEELVAREELIVLGDGDPGPETSTWVIDRSMRLRIIDRMAGELQTYHGKYPLRDGMAREELKSRANIEAKPFALILESAIRDGLLVADGISVRHPEHQPVLNKQEQKLFDVLQQRFREAIYAPPSAKETLAAVGEEVMAYLLSSGWLVRVSKDVVFQAEVYDQMVEGIRKTLKEKQSITVGEVRDLFKTSRKYALALMEHLDEIGVTIREGDARRLS